ncbi:MAG TPA: phosphoribosyltransferase family protein [Candidatus Acidoferrales bacterium]|nr:phosphoribosyltransferase family protein [Candidatus Acidoferrales bacterium]
MIAHRVLSLLFPPRCVTCRAPGSAICGPCIASFGGRHVFFCGALACVAVGSYGGSLRAAVLRFKHGRRELAEPLGALLAQALAKEHLGGGIPLVPIPTTVRRRRARGYDQARLLGAVAARRLGVPALDVLEQTAGDAQRGRSREQRLAASGRFRVRGASPLQGRRVLLVDDVATTGATIRDAAATLERAGAYVAGAAVLARADEMQRRPG